VGGVLSQLLALDGYSGLLCCSSRLFCEGMSGSCLLLDDRALSFLFLCWRLWSWQSCWCATAVFPSSVTSGASAGLSAKASELTKQAANANLRARCFILHPFYFLSELISVSAACSF